MTSSINPIVLKSLISVPIAYILDQKVLKEGDMYSSAYFASSVGAGIYVGSTFGSTVAASIPSIPQSYIGIAERVSEIGLGAGASWALNKWVLKNDKYGTGVSRLAVISASDIFSSLIVDYLNGQPLMII